MFKRLNNRELLFKARDLELAASNALGIEAASFASFENGFWGRGRNEVTEPVEVPRSNLGSETGT